MHCSDSQTLLAHYGPYLFCQIISFVVGGLISGRIFSILLKLQFTFRSKKTPEPCASVIFSHVEAFANIYEIEQGQGCRVSIFLHFHWYIPNRVSTSLTTTTTMIIFLEIKSSPASSCRFREMTCRRETREIPTSCNKSAFTKKDRNTNDD